MPHPQSGQNLFAPQSELQYHVQVFSKAHGDFLSSSIHDSEDDAQSTAKIVRQGFQGQYKGKAPEVRVVKVARHTVYSEPEVVSQKAAVMSPTERRRLERMLADQAKGPEAGRKKPAPKPRKQVVDLTDVDLNPQPTKKKGK